MRSQSVVSMSEKKKWGERSFNALEDITRTDLLNMLHGHMAGIRVPQLLSEDKCELVVGRIRELEKRRGRAYEGNLNIGTPLAIPSHWEFRYIKEDDPAAWSNYFKKVGAATRLRKQLFKGIDDPLVEILAAFGAAWGSPVRHLRHPKFGWALYAGIIRSGAPRLHFDWAPFDLGADDVILQAGVNVYLSNFRQGGDLTMYREYGLLPGNTQASGEPVVGNYDLPRELVANAESYTLRCGAGDMVVAANRFLHEVTPSPESETEANRLVLSFHLVLLTDGSLAVFS